MICQVFVQFVGTAYTFNMGGVAILCTLFVTLHGFRTIPPVGFASLDYYDEAIDDTTPTVPIVRTEILLLDAIAIKIHSYLFICSKNAFS